MDIDNQAKIQTIWLSLQTLIGVMAAKPETSSVVPIAQRIALKIAQSTVLPVDASNEAHEILALIPPLVEQLFDPELISSPPS